MDRESEFYEFQTKLTHEFYTEFKKIPTEFYFESQYFNFEWKITTTLLHSDRNTQQWQVRLKSVLFSQTQQQHIVPIQQLFQHSSQPECKSADAKKLFSIHLNNVVLNFTEF